MAISTIKYENINANLQDRAKRAIFINYAHLKQDKFYYSFKNRYGIDLFFGQFFS